MNAIAKAFEVSNASVFKWIKNYASNLEARPKPSAKNVEIEIDEMWHYVKKKSERSGSGKHFVAIQVNLSTGNLAIATRELSEKCSTG